MHGHYKYMPRGKKTGGAPDSVAAEYAVNRPKLR